MHGTGEASLQILSFCSLPQRQELGSTGRQMAAKCVLYKKELAWWLTPKVVAIYYKAWLTHFRENSIRGASKTYWQFAKWKYSCLRKTWIWQSKRVESTKKQLLVVQCQLYFLTCAKLCLKVKLSKKDWKRLLCAVSTLCYQTGKTFCMSFLAMEEVYYFQKCSRVAKLNIWRVLRHP